MFLKYLRSNKFLVKIVSKMHAFHKFGVLFFLRFEYLLLLQPSVKFEILCSQGAQIAPHPQVHPHTPQSNKKLNYTVHLFLQISIIPP